MPSCSAHILPCAYAPRRPHETVLHRVLVRELETFLAQAQGDGAGLPAYVERELRAVVSCGDPVNGFLRLRCDTCPRELICPFSCGSRTLCPSCATRRMEDLTTRLCGEILPAVPLRQWTVSFPFVLRRLLAADATLLSSVHRSFMRLVFAVLRANAPVVRGRCGAISFIQRFDASLGLDPHLHVATLDGVYAQHPDGSLEFHDTGTPSQDDVETIAVHLHASIRRILIRRGLLTREGELVPPESQDPTPLERLYEAAAREYVASGTLDADGRTRVRQRWPSAGQHLGPRLVDVDGVNVHADLRIEASDHAGRQRLVRYLLRPPFAHQQFSELPDGRIAFALRKRRRRTAGDTHRFFTPGQLLRRLAWLIPPPRQHWVRFQGVLGAAAKWRRLVVPDANSDVSPACAEPSTATASPPPPPSSRRPRRLSWPALLRQAYGFDILRCPDPDCTGRMRVLCAITQPDVIRRILDHLGMPSEPVALAPARGPPGEVPQLFD